ncbi:N-acyl homoserine lactonase family protein [Pusillimonas sp. DMV24BSW_D]|uniref:N-acyl homoserine lactonase family protein n=1 Tax=Neopusillimonas aestuarii TaxID=2716226 RepID=UPI0014077EA4|nr:N-acyl homoserine lactonase family protein [Pusillimonas sp. DMV24BSW_D]QIM50050.1 N-acyl homoserine lactonase family protein [Pusillimonas sp. DMV24BSW_D]
MKDWSIWTFCYAMGKLPYDFLSGSPVNSNRGVVDVPMLVTLLRSDDDEFVLIDTGFATGESMTGNKFADFVRSDQLLSRFGIDPGKIRKVILTHLHFDHAGNLSGFPNAEFFVQRYEYDAWKQVISEFGDLENSKYHWAFSSLNREDFGVLDKLIEDGKVHFLDGDAEVANGVTCRLAKDTHTFGSQWIEIKTSRGAYVCAGDCCYTFENLRRMWPPGYIQGNAWSMLRTFEQMKVLAGPKLERLIPGHDIEVFDHFPTGVVNGVRFVEPHLSSRHNSLIPQSKWE